ncbi:unnamed protein product [Paramecium sonneborni]|uniref:Uncharacterized protein n=1 Tax=Paramecium sonneborni TaxID=65129 RepID=A0A8S1NWU0_9CILI|nr:unnamed protein product [Paramecium sonneborni]
MEIINQLLFKYFPIFISMKSQAYLLLFIHQIFHCKLISIYSFMLCKRCILYNVQNIIYFFIKYQTDDHNKCKLRINLMERGNIVCGYSVYDQKRVELQIQYISFEFRLLVPKYGTT